MLFDIIKGHFLVLFFSLLYYSSITQKKSICADFFSLFIVISIQKTRNIKCDDNISSIVSTATDNICQNISNQSTCVAYHLLSKMKKINRKDNLRKQRIIDNQLDAINFLPDYLNNEILIELLYDLVRELKDYSSFSMNNNHLQLSNNQEKKKKKKKLKFYSSFFSAHDNYFLGKKNMTNMKLTK